MQETQRLLAIMSRLRRQPDGCPWDLEQNFASIAPHTLEEAYEVVDAIERQDMAGLKEELGDLLLQVVFHSQMASEAGLFDFEQVAAGINEKMVRRHPHIFAAAEIKTSAAQTASWEAIKATEKQAKGQHSALDDIPLSMPALARAQKLTQKAARVGFDWPEITPVFAKLDEEVAELKEALAARDTDHAAEELGDVLFVCANLARHIKTGAEDALRAANSKFERRFRAVEANLLACGKSLQQATLAEMDAEWDVVKAQEA